MDPGHEARDDNGEFRVTVEMPSRSERRQGNGWLAPVAAETLPDDPLDKATAWVAQDWLPYLARSAAFGTPGAATRVAADAGDSAADVGGVSGGVHQKRRNPRGAAAGV
jgi:hypothetical protein